jgi:hypothetical protein
MPPSPSTSSSTERASMGAACHFIPPTDQRLGRRPGVWMSKPETNPVQAVSHGSS